MGKFNLWGNENAPPSADDQSSAVEGGSANPADAAGIQNAAADEVIQTHRKRGRKPLTDDEKRDRELRKSQEKALSSFDALYSPETWEGIMASPADLMLALTGKNKLWDLHERERKVLGNTAAMTAKCFAVSDPKWLALSMLCITIMQTYGSRVAIHYADVKTKRKENDALKDRPGQWSSTTETETKQ